MLIQQHVEYYIYYTDAELAFNLSSLENEVIASYEWSKHVSKKIYTYKSDCQ